MTSDPSSSRGPVSLDHATNATAYVWVWLPGASAPVVAGSIHQTDQLFVHQPVVVFVYARSYRTRPDAIPLFTPELPLRSGTLDPTRPESGDLASNDAVWAGYPSVAQRSPTALAGCLRDASPDAWGRRVINLRRAGDPERALTEIAYLLESNSDRVGALDFQPSSEVYVPRGEPADLAQLVDVAELIERGEPIPDELAAAAAHGTSIGGARPKALLRNGHREFVAKFSSTTDDRPVVKAEAVGMLLARQIGLDVPPVEVVHVNGKDVLLVERFDRPAQGQRRMVVSSLTVLGLREEEARYASYADLARAIRYPGWADTEHQLQELYTRPNDASSGSVKSSILTPSTTPRELPGFHRPGSQRGVGGVPAGADGPESFSTYTICGGGAGESALVSTVPTRIPTRKIRATRSPVVSLPRRAAGAR